MGAPAIDFFFEFASPYSYLASLELPDLAARHGAELNWRPIDLREVWRSQGVMEAYGAIRRMKSGYIAKDATRVAAARGVELIFPTARDDPRRARLVFYALAAEDAARGVAFAQAVWRHRFSGRPIGEVQDLVEAFPELCADGVEAACAERGPAALLSEASAAAVESHCFGVPWILCGTDAYFGQDRLYLLEKALDQTQGRSDS